MLSTDYRVTPVILLGGRLLLAPSLMSACGQCSLHQYLVRPEVKILERLLSKWVLNALFLIGTGKYVPIFINWVEVTLYWFPLNHWSVFPLSGILFVVVVTNCTIVDSSLLGMSTCRNFYDVCRCYSIISFFDLFVKISNCPSSSPDSLSGFTVYSCLPRDILVFLCLFVPVCSWPMTKLSSNSLPAHVLKGNSRRISWEGFWQTHGRSFLSGHCSQALVTVFVSSKGGPPNDVAPAGRLCSWYNRAYVWSMIGAQYFAILLLGNKLLPPRF